MILFYNKEMILFYDNNISFCTKTVFVLPYQRIWQLQLLHPTLS